MDITKLLEPLSGDLPCGEDLGYDSALIALESKREGTPEQQMGGSIIEAKPPEWGEVKADAEALLLRSKDLRVVAYYAQAALNLKRGLSGFAKAVSGARQLLNEYWDELYPLLVDEDGDPDPDYRTNAANIFSEVDNFERVVCRTPIVSLQGVGSFSLQDIRYSRGEDDPAAEPGYTVSDMRLIEGAFAECDLDEMKSLLQSVAGAVDDLAAISERFADKLPGAETPRYEGLAGVLQQIVDLLTSKVAQREPAAVAADRAPSAADWEQPMTEATVHAVAPVASVPGQISCREDVSAALERICHYYQNTEPSSPVPMLLERAKSLIDMSFIDLLEDLAPQGVDQAKLYLPKRTDEDASGSDSSSSSTATNDTAALAKANEW